jgi:hypothetical protein
LRAIASIEAEYAGHLGAERFAALKELTGSR